MNEELQCLYELFPAWSKEDLNALYIDLGRNQDLVIARISEGHVSQWSSKTSQHSSSKLNQKQTFRRKAPFVKEQNYKNKTLATKKGPEKAVDAKPIEEQQPITKIAEVSEINNDTEENHDRPTSTEECIQAPTLEEDLVLMPKFLVRPESETIDAPIVVLPNMRDFGGYSVEPPVVNLPFSLRNNDSAPEFAQSYNQGEISSMLSPSIVLDDLFPDSIRKIRQISRTTGFY